MKQPTPLERAASRANGAKSRGPKTAAGKRRSSRSGCKHNLRSRVAPMPPANAPGFLQSLADYCARFRPRAFEAESAVLSLAVGMWLKMRLWPVETEMWDAEVRRQAALHSIFRALDTLEREEKAPRGDDGFCRPQTYPSAENKAPNPGGRARKQEK